jgi:outer membrane scaffolding protein for murein synthesis (MipA/OmpV family)
MRNQLRLLFLYLLLSVFFSTAYARAAEPEESDSKEWKVSVGAGLILAPAFTGAKEYSLMAVPDIRVTYKNLFFANMRDGVGYAVFNQNGWRIGPVVTYTFGRSEKRGGNIFQIAGSSNNSLQGMGDVPGTFSLGGFIEYSLKPFKVELHVNKGITGHYGLAAEARAGYGGTLSFGGSPLIYSFGPHIKFGDRNYTNAYWGVSPEQSTRSGLARYTADGGLTAYGINGFAMLPLMKSVSVSLISGFEHLAPPVTNSSLIRKRGSQNQALGGLLIAYEF